MAKLRGLGAAFLSVANVSNFSMYQLICYVQYDMNTALTVHGQGAQEQARTSHILLEKLTLVWPKSLLKKYFDFFGGIMLVCHNVKVIKRLSKWHRRTKQAAG